MSATALTFSFIATCILPTRCDVRQGGGVVAPSKEARTLKSTYYAAHDSSISGPLLRQRCAQRSVEGAQTRETLQKSSRLADLDDSLSALTGGGRTRRFGAPQSRAKKREDETTFCAGFHSMRACSGIDGMTALSFNCNTATNAASNLAAKCRCHSRRRPRPLLHSCFIFSYLVSFSSFEDGLVRHLPCTFVTVSLGTKGVRKGALHRPCNRLPCPPYRMRTDTKADLKNTHPFLLSRERDSNFVGPNQTKPNQTEIKKTKPKNSK